MKAALIWSSGGYGYLCASLDQHRHRAPVSDIRNNPCGVWLDLASKHGQS